MEYETPNFTVHTDKEGWATTTVDKWPDRIQVSQRLVTYTVRGAPVSQGAMGMKVDKDILEMWCSNGFARYRIVAENIQLERWLCNLEHGVIHGEVKQAVGD